MKIKKIIFTNIIVIFLLLIIAEVAAFSIRVNILIKEGGFASKNKIEFCKKIFKYYLYTYQHYKEPPFQLYDFRKSFKINSQKGNIVLLGCSYTYGLDLKDNEIFSYILSNETNRTVYNLGLNSASPREILYLLRDNNFIHKLTDNQNNTEYVIYTYISDHARRLYYNVWELAPLYKIKNNHLVFKKNNLFTETFLYRESMLFKYLYLTSDKEKNELFQLYIKEINSEIKKVFSYKNQPPKFIILIYGINDEIDFSKIQQIDDKIMIIKVQDIVDFDLLDSKYTNGENDFHPNKKAWENIVPKLVKVINMQ